MPPGMLEEPSNLEIVEFDVNAAELRIAMAEEKRALVELRRPEQSVDELRAGRPLCISTRTIGRRWPPRDTAIGESVLKRPARLMPSLS